MHFSDVEVGKRLFVGVGQPKALKTGEEEVRGSAFIEGPLQTGDAAAFGSIVATQMIARDKNTESDDPPRSLWVKGNTRLEGDDGTPRALNVTGDVVTEGSGTNPAHVLLKGTANADCLVVEGNQTINNGNLHTSNLVSNTFQGLVGSGGAFSGSSINVQGWKGFDIEHPNKEGHRLRHICLEGPEGAIFTRGKIKNENIIYLPDYWAGFVDIDSITVQLQPIGSHQDVIVKRWDAEKVELQAKPGIPIHCFYHIFAERIDGEKLIVEYEGDSPEDYPGDNTQYSIAGYHYDRRTE